MSAAQKIYFLLLPDVSGQSLFLLSAQGMQGSCIRHQSLLNRVL